MLFLYGRAVDRQQVVFSNPTAAQPPGDHVGTVLEWIVFREMGPGDVNADELHLRKINAIPNLPTLWDGPYRRVK